MPKDVHPDELIRVLESGKHGSWGYRAAETVRMLKWAAEQWVATQQGEAGEEQA